MKILIACERSGKVREAFRKRGHAVLSCDIEAADDGSSFHHKGDVREVLGLGWDMMIAFPPCTYLNVAGMHWTTRGLRDQKLTDDAFEFAKMLWWADIPKIAMENPVGILSTWLARPDQIIQPHDFGHDASKKTCLWLKGLPRLVPTIHVPGRLVTLPSGRVALRWANQTDSGQNRLGPSKDRARIRSETYQGIADSMASQWG
jgi:hypothetical protein